MKYLKITIFSIALLFALSAQALEFTVGNLKYTTNADNTSVTVTKSAIKPAGELVIPSHVTYNGEGVCCHFDRRYCFSGLHRTYLGHNF